MYSFGLQVPTSVKLLGQADPSDTWEFLPLFDLRQPWSQRNIQAFCTNLPVSLRVSRMWCWMQDFRTYAIQHYGKFPVFQAEFDSVAERFSYRALSDTSLAAKTLWMRDGFIKASYVSFWLDVDKRSADADFSLELKSRWDAHLDNYNEGASRTAKDAFHTSDLWVMAEAQKELVKLESQRAIDLATAQIAQQRQQSAMALDQRLQQQTMAMNQQKLEATNQLRQSSLALTAQAEQARLQRELAEKMVKTPFGVAAQAGYPVYAQASLSAGK